MKTTRRTLLAVSFSALALTALSTGLTSPAWAAEKTPGEPDKFLSEFAAKAFSQLSDENLSNEEREARFDKLLVEGFNVPAISRFVLGKNWRKASKEERTTFIGLFQEYLAQRFAPLFAGYEGKGVVTKRVTVSKKNPSISWVASELPLPGGKQLKVDWRIHHDDENGDYDILDIKTEQISLVITLRGEFASVIQKQGSVDGLNKELRRQLDRGAFRPKTDA
ncbi:MlaC/ttg2D family ABC transporter substrate-binding protein [Rhodovibrionaceae bacterium A322]